jgi:hypothetical protein
LKISKRVMEIEKFKDSIYYRVSCDCGQPDCDLQVELERDEDFPSMIFLNIYKNLLFSAHWHNDGWFKIQWAKIKAIFRIIFFGYIEVNEGFILKGEEHIECFIQALQQGRNYLKSGCENCKEAKLKDLPECDICGKKLN